jgi:outer membrane protein assembly factor BamB
VHALEAKTGKPLWTFTTRARVDSSPAIAGGRIFWSNDGRVYGLDLASGKKVWEYEAASPGTSPRPSPRARSSPPRPTARSSASDNAKRQQLTASPQKGGNFPLP